MMKMIIAIVQDADEPLLTMSFKDSGIQATKLSSTGNFLREGNTTYLIGVDDQKVDEVLGLISQNCQQRQQYTNQTMPFDGGVGADFPVWVEIGGAMVFVLPVEASYRF